MSLTNYFVVWLIEFVILQTHLSRVPKNPIFFKKSPAHGGFYGVLLGYIGFWGFFNFITIRMTRERGFRVTYLSNIASSGI
jgi:hypothetical protein